MKIFFILCVAVISVNAAYTPNVKDPLPGCQVYNDNQCSGNNIITPPDFEKRRWFTPRRGDADWQAGFQDYAYLAAHAHVVYNPAMTGALVEILVDTIDKNVSLWYTFDKVKQASPTRMFGKETTKPVSVSVSTEDGKSIALEPIDFVWNNVPIAPRKGDYRNGQKGAIVELFGWPHLDVKQECKKLGELGYMGVKLFPVTEHVMSFEPFNNIMNPWYFFYQPVSYKLEGRMGSRNELRDLIQTCRSYGVRVYADAVVNHMVGSGNDANTHHRNPGAGCALWADKNSSMSVRGTKSPFYSQGFQYVPNQYTGYPSSQEFPAAHYGPQDFHCERALNSWNDPLILNAGWLSGLVDLNTERDNVQQRIADFMTDLIGIGFSGFRIDAAKHIQPNDIVAILSKLRVNLGGDLPDDFITWLEVLIGGEGQLLFCNDDSGYNYGRKFEQTLRQAGFSQTDINKFKIWHSGYPKEVSVDCNTVSRIRNAVQNDDADQQNPGSSSRDMADQGCVLVKAQGSGCDANTHKGYEMKLFSNPNGISDNDNEFPIRLILSSFYFGANGAMGIPDGQSDCKLCVKNCNTCNGMPYWKAFDDSSNGYDNTYTRVHRNRDIVNAMRAWMHMPAI